MNNDRITRYLLNIFIVIIIVCGARSSGLALTNESVFSQFQFNFITPGARATALGGAFIGLADDATAVESNPAGLTILTIPEISVEFKHLAYKAEQMYANPSPRTDITRREFDDSVESIPFTSIVFPYNQFVFSLYRQELIHYKSSFRTSANMIFLSGFDRAFYPVDASVDLDVINYGLGVAVQVFEGFSIAFSPSWAKMNMKSYSARFGLNSDPEPTDFSDDDLVYGTRIDDEDSDFSINAGLLWIPHRRFSVGVVYKRGAKFTVRNVEFGPRYGGYNPDIAEFTLNVPDSFGAGIAFRTNDFLTFTFDIVYIRYEDLLDDFDPVIDNHIYTEENYTIDNATEIHFGAEYILTLDEKFVALRVGAYNDPDHSIRFTGITGDPIYDIGGKERFPGGEDQIHITGGVGLVLSDRFQIDAAADFADRIKQLSVSMVYR